MHRPETPAPLALELTLLALLSLLWGMSYGLVKISVATITPLTLVAIRVTLAALVLWVYVAIRQQHIPVEPRTWGAFFVQAILGFSLPFSMITWGQQYVDSGLAGILNSTTPIFVVLIAGLLLRKEQLDTERLTGVLIGMGGVVFLIGTDALAGLGENVAGQLAITGATISYALAMINGKRFAGVPSEITAAGTLTCAALMMIPASLLFERPLELTPSSKSMAALLVLAVFSTAGAFVLYFRLINTLGPLGTSSVGYARAAISVVIGVFLLGEPFGWQTATGLCAVLLGVAATNRLLGALKRNRRALVGGRA